MFNSQYKLLREVLATEKGQLCLVTLLETELQSAKPTEDTHMTYYHMGRKDVIQELVDVAFGTEKNKHAKIAKARDELDSLFDEEN